MRFVNINHINGLIVEYNKEPILITVNAEDENRIIFNMRHAVTDEQVTPEEVRAILLDLMMKEQ